MGDELAGRGIVDKPNIENMDGNTTIDQITYDIKYAKKYIYKQWAIQPLQNLSVMARYLTARL